MKNKTCSDCNGKGKVWIYNYYKYYYNPQKGVWVICRNCGGKGIVG